jgi:dolichol-phosphate mannosyltransferase
MDADLQHPPEVVPELVRKWQEGFKIVHGLRHDPRSVSGFKRATSRFYYRLFTFLSGVAIEEGAADFRLLDRQVLDEILQFQEEGLFLRGIVHWVGYDTASVTFECSARHAGASKYSLRKMLTLGWHGVSAFSLVPLRIGIFIGLLSSTVAFLGVAYAIIGKWIDREAVPGWASSVAISSFLFGVRFVVLAILAEYVGRIVVEVRRRPRFLVRDTTRSVPAAADRRNKPAVLADYRET